MKCNAYILIPIGCLAFITYNIRKTLPQVFGSIVPFLVHHVMDFIDHFNFELLFLSFLFKIKFRYFVVFIMINIAQGRLLDNILLTFYHF